MMSTTLVREGKLLSPIHLDLFPCLIYLYISSLYCSYWLPSVFSHVVFYICIYCTIVLCQY